MKRRKNCSCICPVKEASFTDGFALRNTATFGVIGGLYRFHRRTRKTRYYWPVAADLSGGTGVTLPSITNGAEPAAVWGGNTAPAFVQ